MLEFVDLDAHVIHHTQATDSFDEFILLEGVRWTRHDVDFDAAHTGPDQALDDDGVLIALVLQDQRVLGVVDEIGDAIAGVAFAPDHMGAVAGVEILPGPVGVETGFDFFNFMGVIGDHGEVAGLGEVLGIPVQGIYKSGAIVDDHGFFVSEVEGRIAVEDVDASSEENFTGFFVLDLATAAGRIEHDLNVGPSFFGVDHGLQHGGIGEDEHLDAQRFLRGVDASENRLWRIIGKYEQGTSHITSKSFCVLAAFDNAFRGSPPRTQYYN